MPHDQDWDQARRDGGGGGGDQQHKWIPARRLRMMRSHKGDIQSRPGKDLGSIRCRTDGYPETDPDTRSLRAVGVHSSVGVCPRPSTSHPYLCPQHTRWTRAGDWLALNPQLSILGPEWSPTSPGSQWDPVGTYRARRIPRHTNWLGGGVCGQSMRAPKADGAWGLGRGNA